MKKLVFVVLVFCALWLLGCNRKQAYPFSYVGERNGQSIYLDGQKGKVIYLDETNRIIDYVDLRPNSSDIFVIANNKSEALQNMDRGKKDIPGQDYSITLSTRYYSNRLLYIMVIEPYNDGIRKFANSVSIELSDSKGFLLGEITSSYNWTSIVDGEGKRVSVQSQGSIPITLRNYLEIVSWSPKWGLNN